MSCKYKFRDNDKLYFTTITIINWIDLFVRTIYKDVLMQSLDYCQQNRGLEVYAYCIMTNHVHLIIGSKENIISNLLRDFKRYTAEELHKAILQNRKESRKDWMLWMMERAGRLKDKRTTFRLWLPESHPVELSTPAIAHQKLNYIHLNPVKAGFVRSPEDWLYSSAIDYKGGKGLLEIKFIDPLI